MITVSQSLPVASAESALATSNGAQDGAENGFSQLFAAAQAGARGAASGSGKGGKQAADDGSPLPPGAAAMSLDAAPSSTDLAANAGNAPGVGWQAVADALVNANGAANGVVNGAALADSASELATVPGEALPGIPVPVLAPAQALAAAALPATALAGGADGLSATPLPAAALGALPASDAGMPAAPSALTPALSSAQGAAVAGERLAGRGDLPVAGAAAQAGEGLIVAAEGTLAEDAATLQALRAKASEGGAEGLRVAPGPATADGALPSAAAGTVAAASTAAAADPALPRSPVTLSLSHAPTDPEFAGEVANRLQVFARNGGHEATLQLHPADLGRLQVSITTDGDQARVLFIADSAAARDAIEQSLPRLREMLAQSGLQLAQSDVSGQAFGQADRHDNPAGAPGFAAQSAASAASDAVADSSTEGFVTGVRLVDYYI